MSQYMSKAEFSRALLKLQSLRDSDRLDLLGFMQTTKFDGFGLSDFDPVVCSVHEMAQLIGYQCLQFNGELDHDAMQEIWSCRRKFLIVGEGSDEHASREEMKVSAIAMIDRSLKQVGASL